jgi:hypothetical protein
MWTIIADLELGGHTLPADPCDAVWFPGAYSRDEEGQLFEAYESVNRIVDVFVVARGDG